MTPIELAQRLHARDVVLLADRLLLSLIFVHEGLQLTTHFEGTEKGMAALGVGTPLLLATIALQLGAGLCVALGVLARLGAVALGQRLSGLFQRRQRHLLEQAVDALPQRGGEFHVRLPLARAG
ncbi:MAG: DoxX family protein [Mesorhizobium sp.]|nr:MAG: DoxX family protein [Mesorhizobium sp.]